jgi:hypothetical protein
MSGGCTIKEMHDKVQNSIKEKGNSIKEGLSMDGGPPFLSV